MAGKKEKITGLTQAQVQQRIDEGKVNKTTNNATRSYKQIILGNTVTFFNIINLILLIMVLSVGSFKNTMFIFLILINTVIGIIQEIRTKKTLDDLAILTTSQIQAVRSGKYVTLNVDEIVLDDLIVLKAGDQVPADAIVQKGHVEVNESLLTGESDSLNKEEGMQLFSGSFVTSGKALCKVVHVGEDNYMEQITKEAKQFRRHDSVLRKNLNRILKVIGVIIVPLGIGLFYKQYYITQVGMKEAVLNTVAALLGMIPEGLVLLTSIAMTLGVLRLAQRRTLIQELFCIETLARVDVLCLDKTGTLTEGNICVDRVEILDYVLKIEDKKEKNQEKKTELAAVESEQLIQGSPKISNHDMEQIMGNMMGALSDENATANALKERFTPICTYKVENTIPFSSDRKYSGVAFKEHGSFYIGAVQFLFPHGQEALKQKCQALAQEGYRILVLAHCEQVRKEIELPKNMEPLAIILMSDVIRPEASETLEYFREQGVDVKVISGDDPVTVAAIAKRVGLENADAYIDATLLKTEEQIADAVQHYTVFGRVTPKQKKQMVVALKQQGHTVAMTGDGVNDVLALKEANCSVAMASGSDAAKNCANVVLLDSNFSAMPEIVNEGRRVINNISLSASMFLIKTIFSVLLTLETILIGHAYPFEPIQLSIINGCAVAIPTFLMTIEPSFQKVDQHFFRKVLRNAAPPALTITITVITAMYIGEWLNCPRDMLTTVVVLTTGWTYMTALQKVYSPMTAYRKVVIYAMQTIYLICMIVGQNLLELESLNFNAVIILLGILNFSPMLMDAMSTLYRVLEQKFDKCHGLLDRGRAKIKTKEKVNA
ncbi:MAG: HAD-IC family P-type ATPase [Lachnospiraceae bacterium]|nr:HAD-IC family P-type ATPase [Robinsoniella sp.]MDY3766801.1 HAD-IC family P-type ATPase [Lachnospiraceae bacterium]